MAYCAKVLALVKASAADLESPSKLVSWDAFSEYSSYLQSY